MYNQEDVTLVVVNFSQRPAMELMLKTYIIHHYQGSPLKLILVDNHSTDDSFEWLTQNEIPFYPMGENIGHENALNFIFDQIKTKDCLIADTDLEFLENVYDKYLPFINDTCKIVGDYITGDQLNAPVKPRVGAWFLLTDIAAMKEKRLTTFRDKPDWSYDVLSQYTEFVLENGFTIHHIPRLNKDIDHEIISMRYEGFNHIGKVSWEVETKHRDREYEVHRRRRYILERLTMYDNIELKGKFI